MDEKKENIDDQESQKGVLHMREKKEKERYRRRLDGEKTKERRKRTRE